VGINLGFQNSNLKNLDHVRILNLLDDKISVKNNRVNFAAYFSIPSGNKFEFQSGLVFTKARFEYFKENISFNSEFYSINLESEFYSIILPLNVKFNNRTKKISPVFGLGVLYCHRNFNKNVFQINDSDLTQNLLFKNTFCFTLSTGIRFNKVLVEYQIGKYDEYKLNYNEHTISLGYIF